MDELETMYTTGALTALVLSYLIGSIPSAYIIVRAVTGEDITAHGTGNVGAMNVRRSTGSWGWFVIAMVSDALKGAMPKWFETVMTRTDAPLWGYCKESLECVGV